MAQYRILHSECSMVWGGQEKRVIDECRGMMDRGHEVVLVCQPGSVVLQRAEQKGIPVFVTRMKGAFDATGIAKVLGFIRAWKPDVVNTHGSRDSWTVLIAARMAGFPVTVRSRHNSAPIGPNLKSNIFYGKLCDGVSTTGEGVSEYIRANTSLSSDRVVSISSGIDLSIFDPDSVDGGSLRDELGIPRDVPLFGTVGKLQPYKGPEVFVEAAGLILQEIPSAMFVMVGETLSKRDSDIKENMIRRMAELGITEKIVFAGFREDIPRVMKALDVFILASINNEGIPQVVNQAMAMRIPVVGTDVGCVREQVLDGITGYLIQPSDPQAISTAAISMFKDPEKSREMGLSGRKLVEEKYSLTAMLDSTESFYSHLMSLRGH